MYCIHTWCLYDSFTALFSPNAVITVWETYSGNAVQYLQPPLGYSVYFARFEFFQHTRGSPSITHPPVFACGHLSSIHTRSFPQSPSIPLLKQASFAVSFLTFFFSSPVSFFPQRWQAVQILAVCCSPLILCQTFLLRKYTRISEEMQSFIRWPTTFTACDTVFKINSPLISWYFQVQIMYLVNIKFISFFLTQWREKNK